jgi:APA family basic amino acid/polyamine antiporter
LAERGGWFAVALHLSYALYAYSGWNGAAYLAGEIRDPVKNLPRSLVAGSLLVTALYLLMNALYVYALSPTAIVEIDQDRVQTVGRLSGEILFGAGASQVLSLVFGVGMLATISALLFTGPRIAFMMARDGLIPRLVGWLHPERHTPIPATVLLGGISLSLLWSGSFNAILDYTAIGLTTLSALTVASIFPLRGRADWPSRFRTPLYPLPPIFFLVLTAFTVILAIQDSPGGTTWRVGDFSLTITPTQVSIVTILAGFPIYFCYALVKRWMGDPVLAAGPMDARENS